MSSKYREHWNNAGGAAPEDWDFVSIEELLQSPKSISVGVMYPGDDTPGGIPLVRVADVKDGAISQKPDFCVSKEVDHEYRRTKLNGDELLITLVGNPGDCVVVTNEMTGWNVARALAVLRLQDPELRPWLRYVLLSKPAKHLIDARLNTTVQKTLNLKDIKELAIPLPSEITRNAIVKVASDLERKIVLNRQINQTLEQIAQTIFKSWFVDFEPVKAKIQAKQTLTPTLSQRERELAVERAAMRAISGLTDEQIDALSKEKRQQLTTTAALFPDELEDSELGEIPKGWLASNIGNEFDVTMGQSPPGDTYNETGEGMPFFQGRRDFGCRYPVNRVYCTAPKRLARKGDTLLSVRAPVGDVNKATSDCCIGRGISALRHKSGCEAFTYYSLQRLEQHFNSFDSEGTVFGSINQKDLKALPIIKPTNETLTKFSGVVGSIDKKIRVQDEEIMTSSAFRDSLLPKLLSGEITLGDSQSTAEVVA